MSELKMSDIFNLPLFSDGYMVISETIDDPEFGEIRDEIDASCGRDAKAIVQAINNHDRLVEENQRLTAIATKHATVNDERYELLEKQKSDIEKMLDQLFMHEKVDAWLVCKMNDMLDDVNYQLEKSRIEAEKGDGICN